MVPRSIALPCRLLLVCALAILAAARLAAGPAEPLSRETIGQVWSGHPVGFALLCERGYQFVAYYDGGRRITVMGRRLGDKTWAVCHPAGRPVADARTMSNVTYWDSHNTLRLALDRDGYLHLAGNMHAQPLVYYRSSRPFDVTSLECLNRMTGERETSCTYPVFFRDFQGNLLFRYRDGRSGNGSDIYNRYDEKTRQWTRALQTALTDGEGHRNGYPLDPVLGPDHRFHLVWMWRETPDCATNNTLSYARSADFVHWEDSQGRPVTLPITRRTGDVVDAAPPHGGLINMTFNLGFDAAQRPVVVYHRYDAQGHSQLYAARPTPGGGWAVTQLSDWSFRWGFSGGGSIEAEVTVGAPRSDAKGGLLVDYWTKAIGGGRWRLDEATLKPVEQLPASAPLLPTEFSQPRIAGLEVQSVAAHTPGRRWVLRWETMPRNRDQPRASAPAPTDLELLELPAADFDRAGRVGA